MQRTRNVWMYIVIAIAAVFVIVGSYFAVQYINDSKQAFVRDGYVLQEATEAETGETQGELRAEPVYFSGGSEFEVKYPDTVVFSDVQDNKVSVETNSFLHFSDGSKSALSAGVVMDLSEINDDSMTRYYLLQPETVMTYSGGSYTLDHVGVPIVYNLFIWKLEPEKYLIADSTITFESPNMDPIEYAGYVELNFIDNSIVTLSDSESVISTIASGGRLVLSDGISIDLDTQDILSGTTQRFNLKQIVLDSSQNIELTPLAAEDEGTIKIPTFRSVDGQDGLDGDDGNAGAAGGAGSGGSAGAQGEVVPLGGGDEENPDEEEEKPDPEEIIVMPKFDVTTTVTGGTITGNVIITDDGEVMVLNSTKMRIVDNETGELVAGSDKGYDGMQFPFDFEGLEDGKEYRLIFDADVLLPGSADPVTRNFYDKPFMSDSIGISTEIDDIKTNAITVKIKKELYSPVTNIDVAIYDKATGAIVERKSVAVSTSEQSVTFNAGLTYDHKYEIRIENVGGRHEDGTTISIPEYGSPVEVMTLKRPVTIGVPNATINKVDSKFELQASSFSDPDSSLIKMRYDIYELGPGGTETTTPITSAYGEGTSRVDFAVAFASVGDTKLARGVYYYARAVAITNDNNKIVEVESNASQRFMMENADYPTLTFDEDIIQHDRIKGTFDLDRMSAVLNTVAGAKLKWIDSVGNQFEKDYQLINPMGTIYSFDFDESGLRKDETYTFWVEVEGKLSDSNTDATLQIGPVKVNTVDALSFQAVWDDKTVNPLRPNAQLKGFVSLKNTAPPNPTQVDPPDYEASTLGYILFQLYEGNSSAQGNLIGEYRATGTGGDIQASTLGADIYSQHDPTKGIYLNEDDFNVPNLNAYTSSTFTIKILRAHDYTSHDENEFTVYEEEFVFIRDKQVPADPTGDGIKNALRVTAITKQNAATYGLNATTWPGVLGAGNPNVDDIKDDTILGYRVMANFDNSWQYLRSVTYSMYMMPNFSTSTLIDEADPDLAARQLVIDDIKVKADKAYTTVPDMVVLFAPQSTATLGVIGTQQQAAGPDQTERYYYYTGYEQYNAPNQYGRGGQYIYSYKGMLNTDENSDAETLNYPNNTSLFLYSAPQNAKMQEPVFTFHPSTTNTQVGSYSLSWRYAFNDYDGVLSHNTPTPNELICQSVINTGVISREGIVPTPISGGMPYRTVTFTSGFNAGDTYRLYAEQNLYRAYVTDMSLYEDRTMLTRKFERDYFDSTYLPTNNIYYKIVPAQSQNRIFFLLGTDVAMNSPAAHRLNIDTRNRIAGVEVTVQGNVHTTPKQLYLSVQQGNVNNQEWTYVDIPFTSISEYNSGETLSFTLRAFCDQGASGLNASTTWKAIQYPTGDEYGQYSMFNVNRNRYEQGPTANASLYSTGTFDETAKTFTYTRNPFDTSAGSNNPKTIQLDYREGGAFVRGASPETMITIKELGEKTLAVDSSGTSTYTMDNPIPEVRAVTISPTLISAHVSFNITGTSVITSSPKIVYAILYPAGSNLEITRIPIDVSGGDGNYDFNFTGLSINTGYEFKLITHMTLNSVPNTEVSLYDYERKKNEVLYPFQTLDSVDVDNFAMTYTPTDYNNKTLTATFTLNTTLGYRLAYDFVRDDNAEMNHEAMVGGNGIITNLKNPSASVSQTFNVNPSTAGGNYFLFGRSYRVYITAYTGTRPSWADRQNFVGVGNPGSHPGILGQKVSDFTLTDLRSPMIGLSATASVAGGVHSMSVKVTPNVADKTVVDDLFYVRLYDKNGVAIAPQAPDTFATVYNVTNSSIPNINFTNLTASETYTVRCYAVTDINNVGGMQNIQALYNSNPATAISDQYQISSINATTLDNTGISVGTVQVATNADPTKLQLNFINSSQIDDVTKVMYTIVKGTDIIETSRSLTGGDLVFQSAGTAPDNYRFLVLPTQLSQSGTYKIQVQYFYGPGGTTKLGADATYEYVYTA